MTKVRMGSKKGCQTEGCTKLDVGEGHCVAHGGGRRCQTEGYTKLSLLKLEATVNVIVKWREPEEAVLLKRRDGRSLAVRMRKTRIPT